MSILVKDAHLPANCDECMNIGGEDGFQLNLAISRYGAKCPLIEGFVSADDIQSGSERHKDCPLSEAPASFGRMNAKVISNGQLLRWNEEIEERLSYKEIVLLHIIAAVPRAADSLIQSYIAKFGPLSKDAGEIIRKLLEKKEDCGEKNTVKREKQ